MRQVQFGPLTRALPGCESVHIVGACIICTCAGQSLRSNAPWLAWTGSKSRAPQHPFKCTHNILHSASLQTWSILFQEQHRYVQGVNWGERAVQAPTVYASCGHQKKACDYMLPGLLETSQWYCGWLRNPLRHPFRNPSANGFPWSGAGFAFPQESAWRYAIVCLVNHCRQAWTT